MQVICDDARKGIKIFVLACSKKKAECNYRERKNGGREKEEETYLCEFVCGVWYM